MSLEIVEEERQYAGAEVGMCQVTHDQLIDFD